MNLPSYARNDLDIELVAALLSAPLKFADEPPSHCAEVAGLFRTPALGLIAPDPPVNDILSITATWRKRVFVKWGCTSAT